MILIQSYKLLGWYRQRNITFIQPSYILSYYRMGKRQIRKRKMNLLMCIFHASWETPKARCSFGFHYIRCGPEKRCSTLSSSQRTLLRWSSQKGISRWVSMKQSLSLLRIYLSLHAFIPFILLYVHKHRHVCTHLPWHKCGRDRTTCRS